MPLQAGTGVDPELTRRFLAAATTPADKTRLFQVQIVDGTLVEKSAADGGETDTTATDFDEMQSLASDTEAAFFLFRLERGADSNTASRWLFVKYVPKGVCATLMARFCMIFTKRALDFV